MAGPESSVSRSSALAIDQPPSDPAALTEDKQKGQIVIVGKPAKFTKQTLDIFFKALLAGTPVKYALAAANISEKDFSEWLKKEKQGNCRFYGFQAQVDSCRNKGIFQKYLRHRQLSENDIRAIEWELEHDDVDTFSPKAAMASKVAHSGSVKIVFEDLDDKKKKG